VRECGLAKLVLFESPVIAKVQALLKAHWPVIVLPLDGVLQCAALRMALNASIGSAGRIEPRGIDDVRSRGAACSLPGPWQRSHPTFHSVTEFVRMS
jgi:hypothetical protein